MTSLVALLIEAAPCWSTWAPWAPWPVLLLATVLYNVLFVATVSVAAVWPKNYVRIVDLDANVGVAPSVYGILPYPGAESGQGRGQSPW